MKKYLTPRSLKQSILFGLLLALTTHAWAACEAEATQAKQARNQSEKLPDWFISLSGPTKDFPKDQNATQEYLFSWIGFGNSPGYGIVSVRERTGLVKYLRDFVTAAGPSIDSGAADRILESMTGKNSYTDKLKVDLRLQQCMALHYLGLSGTTNRVSIDAGSNSVSNRQASIPNQPNNVSQQQLQAAVTQSQTRAREAQQRGDADAQRRGRRMHDPAAEAHECIRPIFTGLYGAFENTCNFPVYYSYCAFRPKSDSWLTSMDCEKQQFGSWEVGPNRQSAAHTKGAESIHWFACKNPAWALDKSFDGGQIQGRCRVVGGN
jgi:hypothetical protein